ncbi:DUF4381 domain-containing protein [Chachezhania antarctica]|uniref:DUF4381 domain-containing protein n=1 Tax=Chachezhania antarctica TaxID=2340860 RepID=UPI000EB340DC|nr:DUF4381 domain-containing protein [Chachezhania antarctica]|tara:strand:+ start:1143 stop:1649 length:507 start_codon:yes stop_codon:yes gene_type:complete
MNGDDTTAEAPENLVSLIDSLVDPVPPPPVSMMPQTWGWAVLAGLLVLLIAVLVWRAVARHRANAYRRAALAELAAVQTTAGLATLLRRTALAVYPRTQVAGLLGPDWTGFLDHTAPKAFETSAQEELRALYRDEAAVPSQQLREAAARWIETHRVDLAENPDGEVTA